MSNKSPKTSKPVQDFDLARRKSLRKMAAGATAVTAAGIAQERWVRPVTESILLPAHAQLTREVFNCGPEKLTSSSVYINIDPELGSCGISDNSGPNNAMRINNADPNISINVTVSEWTVVAGGDSIDGNNTAGPQTIAVQSNSSSMAFLVSFTATNSNPNVSVSGTTVQKI